MAFEYTNNRGVKYYLHQQGKLLFFSKKIEKGVPLPPGYDVVENSRTGLPMLKKK